LIDTGDKTVDALVAGLLVGVDTSLFNQTELTYSFDLIPVLEGVTGYTPLNQASIDRHLEVFAEITALTGLEFRESDPNLGALDLYFTFRESTETAFVVELEDGGILHVYNPIRDTPILGSYTDHLILHELGHGLGLEHGHDPGALPRAFQGHSWSLMSYRAHPGTESLAFGDTHGPETYMAADIAALQYLYGANFETAAGDTTYSVDFDTGEFFIDGESQGVPNNREVLRSIWDGSGNDTLDLSSATSDLSVDLRPGQFTSFGPDYLAYQGESRLRDDLFAEGNLANPYLFEGNIASLLENAIGGTGDDQIIGNVVTNSLNGGAGQDSLFGREGDDVLVGGEGDDVIIDGIGATQADGGAGRDFVVALSGDGTLRGGDDDDIIIGGIGGDALFGEAGNDVLRGEAGIGFLFGADTLSGGTGDDLLMGGGGADRFEFTTDDGADVIGAFALTDVKVDGTGTATPNGADFVSGFDQIILTGFSTVDADNVLDFVTDGDDGAVFAAEGTTITFFDLLVADLSVEDFVFA